MIILPRRFISSALTALSRSVFFTTIEILDSDGLCEIIIMFTPTSARVENIFAAVPGAPTMLPPLTSINPLLRIALTHFTVFFVPMSGVAITFVPKFFVLNVLLILIGIFFERSGSKVRG